MQVCALRIGLIGLDGAEKPLKHTDASGCMGRKVLLVNLMLDRPGQNSQASGSLKVKRDCFLSQERTMRSLPSKTSSTPFEQQ